MQWSIFHKRTTLQTKMCTQRSTGTVYIWISELGQPLQSYFGLYRQFTISRAAEEYFTNYSF